MQGGLRTSSGGRVDRGRPVSFTFDGERLMGFAGDTLASALLANGRRLVGRSFKYHRPRGVLTAGAEEPNALVGIHAGSGRFTPNLRATQVLLEDGLVATSQNRWPSLRFDIGALNGLAGHLFSAGFYYKTFMGPEAAGDRAWRRIFEPVIRRAAGLGAAPTEADPDVYAQFHDHCDVLVVGAGPAGIAAALAAGRSGARTILCDEQAEPGGSLLAEASARIDGAPAAAWLAASLLALAAMPNVRVMSRTQAFGYFAQNHVALCEQVVGGAEAVGPRERLWQVRAGRVVVAAGAIERPLVFPGNDLPGVMLADAARTYLNRYGVKAGAAVVIATAHDSAYRAALDLAAAGAGVTAIADLRANAEGALPEEARAGGLRVLTGAKIRTALGRQAVTHVEIAVDGRVLTLPCDALLMSGGWTPSVHLYSQSRGKVVFDEGLQAFVPGPSVQDWPPRSMKERRRAAMHPRAIASRAIRPRRAAGWAMRRASIAARPSSISRTT
jgi:sarcosine oxidase, subunit alpha